MEYILLIMLFVFISLMFTSKILYVKKRPIFTMYYAPWCGHCKTAMPEFDKLASNPPDGVKVVKINCDEDENKELAKAQNIQGFPTIRYYKNGMNGDFQEYNGERTSDGFTQFLQNL